MGLFSKKPKDPISKYMFLNFGVTPINIALYKEALTHKSFDQNLKNNERLEFLGDSVIDTIVAEFLFENYPNEDEGFLTKMRSRIVSRESLNELGKKLNVLQHVRYYKGNNQYKSLEGNVLEAIVGAMYRDFGYEKTKAILYKKVLKSAIDLNQLENTDTDYKSQLLIWAQKNDARIEYKLQEVHGDQKKYLAKLFINGELRSEAVGNSKKEAEKRAAKSTCINLKQG